MNVRRIAAGALLLAVLLVGWVLLSGDDDGYRVEVEFPNAGGLRKNSSVKIAGVPGGTVKALRITDRDTAIATLRLDPDAAPIGRGASAAIRPTDLLGERYVALDVGDQRRPLASGATIPRTRATLPVELDDVLNTFDADTRTRLQVLINEFGVALGSRGKDLAKLLDAMPPSLDDARRLVAEIANENGSLTQLIDQGDRIVASVNGKRDDLTGLIEQADRTLREVAERRASLGRTLDAAPGGLARLRSTLAQLDTTATSLRPAAADLERAAGPLRGTLAALPGFREAATDSLKAATAAAPKVEKLGRDAVAPLQRLVPTLQTLRQVSDTATKPLNQLEKRSFEDALWFLQNWSLATKNRDSLGHFVGAKVSVGTQTLYSILDSLRPAIPNGSDDPSVNWPDPEKASAAARAAVRRRATGDGDRATAGMLPQVVGHLSGAVRETAETVAPRRRPAPPAEPTTSAARTTPSPGDREPVAALLNHLLGR
ncbi:MlaD family protein [Patulibacter defluvii]|uniref:MlaD family protein n=1 Tax=Patulibacter defluvii TaxID=3095358 RepID=UPI002A761519|nr:MlaD family protein [Patulibacter sp. DM4]